MKWYKTHKYISNITSLFLSNISTETSEFDSYDGDISSGTGSIAIAGIAISVLFICCCEEEWTDRG